MASEALQAFIQRDFAEAQQALLSLSNATSENLYDPKAEIDDPRVKHNALILQFYSKQTEESLITFLSFIANTLPKDKRPKEVEQLFMSTILDTTAFHFLHARLGSVSLYNLAVIAYHHALIKPAERIATFLYSKIDALEDWLALRLCFLLIDIHLRLVDIPAATIVASHAEKLLPRFVKTDVVDEDNQALTPSEIETLATHWNGRKSTILETPTSYEDAKFCLHIYNARISVFSDGSRSNRKEAKIAVDAADDTESRPTSAALLVKARVEQSYSKGLRILASIITQSASQKTLMNKVRPLALNSLGVLHHRLGRHALAACYFEQSRRCFLDLFSENTDTEKEEKKSAVTLNLLTFAKDSHVCYNLALQYMKLSDYSRALDLFTICARRDPLLATESAILWIRMAECCIGLEWNGADRKQALSLEGQGRGRRMVMRVQDKRDELSIQYAATCARAALDILDLQNQAKVNMNNEGVKESDHNGRVSETNTEVQRKSSQVSAKELQLRTSALTLLAYSSLSFDPATTVEACNQLRKIYPKGDSEQGMLGYLYAAEAFCKLNRPEDAANRLSFLFSMNVTTDSNIRDAAKINLALTHAANGDLVKASRAAKLALEQTRTSPKRRREAIFAASYIFLRSGETESARVLLRSMQNLTD